MAQVHFAPLDEPTPEIAAAFTRWENDPALIPFSRPNQTPEDLERRTVITVDALRQRAQCQRTYLIFLDAQLIGEMSYQVDPAHLWRREPGTAWLGIVIGEASGRGRGVGRQAIGYLEQQILLRRLPRIELGVFAFNLPALTLYRRLGYTEIGRLDDFTYWQNRMWPDIRMEKYLPIGTP